MRKANQVTFKPIRSAERWFAISDNHGDERDTTACRVALEFARFWKPKIRLHLGDCFDFRWLRSKAGSKEREERIGDDIAAGLELLAEYKPTTYLLGNHEDRLMRELKGGTERQLELAEHIWTKITGEIDLTPVPYNKRTGVFRLGGYAFVHGYHRGINAVKSAAQCYGDVLMGHVHRVDELPVSRLPRAVGRSIGCLCNLDMDYNAAQAGALAQSHGFAYGHILRGKLIVYQAKVERGVWILPSETLTV